MSSVNTTEKHNITDVSSVIQFAEKTTNCDKPCFCRVIGANCDLLSDVKKVDEILTQKTKNSNHYYNRIKSLPNLINPDDVSYYLECCNSWNNQGRQNIAIKASNNNNFSSMLSVALKNTVKQFKIIKSNASVSMENNFVVKLIFWFDYLFNNKITGINKESIVKIIAENIEKPQEYLFFYLLANMGFDVLLLQSSGDISSDLKLLDLSKELYIGTFDNINLPEYNLKDYRLEDIYIPHTQNSATTVVNRDNNDYITVKIPPRNRKKSSPNINPTVNRVKTERPPIKVTTSTNNVSKTNPKRQEMDYEQLAMLAKSIVMISVHNQKGEKVAVGSGIMIGASGYILTNMHVACGGTLYTVRIEDDDKVYSTTDIIKYNTTFDLAIIRIDRRLTPLPIYKDSKELVRGQKVVAIGSPLGLFNTVSDGIISGFRNIDNVEMIQFTAPISHGSSGGAVINVYGEVIGISTSGIDSGQNINLAVGYSYINDFIRGFV